MAKLSSHGGHFPQMVVNVLAIDGFYLFVGSLAEKTNMLVKYYWRYFTFHGFLPYFQDVIAISPLLASVQ